MERNWTSFTIFVIQTKYETVSYITTEILWYWFTAGDKKQSCHQNYSEKTEMIRETKISNLINIHVNLLPQKCWRNFLENWQKKLENFVGLRYVKKMWVNNAKITYHVQRDVHLHFLNPINQEK